MTLWEEVVTQNDQSFDICEDGSDGSIRSTSQHWHRFLLQSAVDIGPLGPLIVLIVSRFKSRFKSLCLDVSLQLLLHMIYICYICDIVSTLSRRPSCLGSV